MMASIDTLPAIQKIKNAGGFYRVAFEGIQYSPAPQGPFQLLRYTDNLGSTVDEDEVSSAVESIYAERLRVSRLM